MRSFEEYWNEHGDVYAMEIAENAWDYQQSKIDELQAKFDQHDQWLGNRNKDVQELNNIIAKHVTEKDELQKRVDAAQKLIDDWNFGGVHIFDLLDELEQALKGGSTPNLNTDENGECRHFSTTMFADGKAECFQCDAVVNEQREVIGKQSKDLHPFFKREPK